MSTVPRGWKTVPLVQVCDINPRDRGPEDQSVAVSFIPMPAVSETEGVILDHVAKPFAEVANGYTRFREQDVIFAKITPCMENGKSAVATDLHGGFACGSTEFHVLRSNGKILPHYLWRFVRQESFRKNAERHMTGAVGQRRVPAQYMKDAEILLPPVPEQRRILDKLDSLLKRSRSAREELAHLPRLVERYRGAVLAAAFCGRLTADWRTQTLAAEKPPALKGGIDPRVSVLPELPDNWMWTSISSIASITGGLTKNAQRRSLKTTAPYLRVANVYANELRLDDVAEIGCTKVELEKTRLMAGDLLIVEGNGSLEQIGRVALWNAEVPNCSHQNHIIRARLGPMMLPKFALYWLLSPGGRSAIEQVASSSSGLHTLSISKVQGLPAPICALAEQEIIVDRIETAFTRIDGLFVEASRARTLVDRLDQSTLSRAFRGELL